MAYPTTIDSILSKTDSIDRLHAADVNVLQDSAMALQNLIGAGSFLPTANATASTIVKLNSSGDASFNYVNATAGVQVAKSTQAAAVFALDAANLGSSFTLANNAIAYPFGLANNFCGLVIVKETVDGHTAFLLSGGQNMIMLGETSGGTIFSTTATTASRINIYPHGSLYCPSIENKRGGSRTFHVLGIRLASSY